MENEKKAPTSIKHWAADDRPREKLLKHGPDVLSASELLAILISTGSMNKSAIDLAKDILALGKNDLNELGRLNVKDLQKVKGIGEAKAVTILAALELGKRRQAADVLNTLRFRSSSQIAAYLRAQYSQLNYEVFAVLYLNQSNKLIHEDIISRGGITGTVADPILILKTAIQHEAKQLVLCHNHPSGNLQPSQADKALTEKLKQGAALMDIKVLDHIIVSEEGYYSFADEGMV